MIIGSLGQALVLSFCHALVHQAFILSSLCFWAAAPRKKNREARRPKNAETPPKNILRAQKLEESIAL